MNRLFSLSGLISLPLILCCFPTYAATTPWASEYDTRIQYVNYSEGDVTTIRALPGLGSRIVFAANEEILDVASGFTQGWEFVHRRNILYIKPKSVKAGSGRGTEVLSPRPGEWDTNLMVTTNWRLYDFDLYLLPGDSSDGMSRHVTYRMEFRYPGDAKQKRRAARRRAATQAALEQKPAPRNWAYSMQIGDNSAGIAPTMAYDDGRFTYLRFPNNRDFPSVFIVAEDKSESLVNTHVDKDILVIHRIVPELVLRLGKAVVGVYNENYDADGIPPNDGTTIPGVRRLIKQAKAF